MINKGSLNVNLHSNEKEGMLKRYTDNIEAYNFYQQGCYFFNQLNMTFVDEAVKSFKRAKEIDPGYALAYVGLAGCYFAITFFGAKKNSEINGEMKMCIETALRIDENLPDAYLVLALYLGCMEWNQPDAYAAYVRSLELNPDNVRTLRNFSINRVVHKEFYYAEILARKAKLLDPLSEYTELCVLFLDFYRGSYDKVLEPLMKFQQSDPPFWWGLFYLWRTLSLLGRKKEAVQICKKSFIIAGFTNVANQIENAGIDNAFETAAFILSRIYEHIYVSPYNIALLYQHAQKSDLALLWIEKALESRDPGLIFLDIDPEWKNIRSSDIFMRGIKEVGFPIPLEKIHPLP